MKDVVRSFEFGAGQTGCLYSLPALEEMGIAKISRLPISIRVVLESVMRNCDGDKITWGDVEALARWNARKPSECEIPFIVARIILQDFTGVPLLVDLAAMRSAVAALGGEPRKVEPLVPVDLVVDHSVQVDHFGSGHALARNLEIEFLRNRERYEFLKWGQQAFDTFKVVPPGIGIVHQVNLEYLAKGVLSATTTISGRETTVYYPDTLVGTDSHTTMINGLGVVGWGVGGIEAEAGMLGQPIYFLTPEVVGVHLSGALREGVTATDLVLHITEMLRERKVVGKFVEFFGEGAAALGVTDRATISNMAPEYGATMGFFGIDEKTVEYLRQTGRDEALCQTVEAYYKAQKMWGIPRRGEVDYSVELELNLADVVPAVAGPRRPQDRIALDAVETSIRELLSKPVAEGGFGKSEEEAKRRYKVSLKASAASEAGSLLDPAASYREADVEIADGSVVIASITSCTNTSNPSVMLGAGLLARKAVERGLTVHAAVKTSLAPGSRIVTDYLVRTGLQPYLDKLGFQTVGYGCATCIGNSGPLHPALEKTVLENNLVVASVLSGNRNFEARIHQNVRANFLMSPPLVVAFALAGRVDIDLQNEPLGVGAGGEEVYLRDIWPSLDEIRAAMAEALSPETYRAMYADFASQNPRWGEIETAAGEVYAWNAASTYIQEPPFFEGVGLEAEAPSDICDARALGVFGDSVTTDHISPAGAIKPTSPAGRFLVEQGVERRYFNSYGSRRGNDLVMTRGTFANVRIKNRMVPGVEGGYTFYMGERELARPDAEFNVPAGAKPAFIYDAAMAYREEGRSLIVVAGHEYGTGSSRDWAAKGTALLGVKAVVAASYERIHRSNLCGMGVLPLQFPEGVDAETLQLDGTETYDVLGISTGLAPRRSATLRITRRDGSVTEQEVRVRLDTQVEVEYYRHGGILPYVLRQIMAD